MANDVTVRIGADATQLKTGIGSVRQELDKLKKTAKEGFFDLENERRVERNLGAMVQGLTNATSASEALAIGLDRIENIFKSSLGASVAVAAIAALIGKFQEAEKAAEDFKKSFWESINSANRAIAEGNPEQASAGVKAQIQAIEKEIERLNGGWSKAMNLASMFFGGVGNADEVQRLRNAIVELDRIRTTARRATDAKYLEEAAKAEDELQAKILKEQLEAIAERNDEEDKAAQKQAERVAKMAFDAQEAERQWREQMRKEDEEFEKEKAERHKEALQEKVKREKDAAELIADNQREMADLVAKLEQQRAEQQREAINKRFEDEITKTPQQRQFERQQAAYEQRLDERAARRMAAREQSASNGRMSDQEKEARVRELIAQRKDAKNEMAPLQKTATDIKVTLDKFLKNIGIK